MIAQEKIITYSIENGSIADIDTSVIKFPSTLDSGFLEFRMRNIVSQLHQQSFLASNLDSIVFCNDSTACVYMYLGSKLVFGEWEWAGLSPKWLENPILRNLKLEGSYANPELYQLYIKNLLKELEENGYPLAKINIVKKYVEHDTLKANLELDTGPLIEFAGLHEANDSIISPDFLIRYLDIQPGEIFRMSKVVSIEEQLNQLSYIRLKKAPQIKIDLNKAYVSIPVKEIPASRFDFLIGVLPNVENESQFTISGELTADFRNKLKRGEELFVHFRQLKPETQRIDFRAMYPYLLNLPFGIHSTFSLYRNGVESRDLNSEIGIQYRSGKNLESRFFINYQSSRLIEIDTMSLLNTGLLPASLDVRLNNIGARITNDLRDYRFNPRKGLLMQISATAGIKNILPNLTITSISNDNYDFSTAYDTLDLQVFQTSGELLLEYFIPIKKASTIKVGNTTQYKWSQSDLYFNEYYRVGGAGNLRGFDEESIRAQFFNLATLEYRYLLSLNSYFSVFFDYGVVYNDFRIDRKWDTPFGFGAGLSFQTNAGIFGIDVAVGRQLGNPLDFRNAKTHFGFISLF